MAKIYATEISELFEGSGSTEDVPRTDVASLDPERDIGEPAQSSRDEQEREKERKTKKSSRVREE